MVGVVKKRVVRKKFTSKDSFIFVEGRCFLRWSFGL